MATQPISRSIDQDYFFTNIQVNNTAIFKGPVVLNNGQTINNSSLTINAPLNTIGLTVNGNGTATAAKFVAGTGSNAIQVTGGAGATAVTIAAGAGQSGLGITGNGAAPAETITASSTGVGLNIVGGAGAAAETITAGAAQSGISVTGNGAAPAGLFTASTTGGAIRIVGGAGFAAETVVAGAGQSGINVTGNGAAAAATFTAGSGNGITVTGPSLLNGVVTTTGVNLQTGALTNLGSLNGLAFPGAANTVFGMNGSDAYAWLPFSAAGLSSWGMFYGLTAGTGNGGSTDYAATIAVHTSAGTGRVPFPRNGPSYGGIVSQVGPSTNIDQVLLPNIGYYMCSFNVHTTELGQLQFELNGAAQYATTASNFNPTSGGHEYSCNCMIQTTTVNSILAVINPAGNSTALTITPANGSQTTACAQRIQVIQIA